MINLILYVVGVRSLLAIDLFEFSLRIISLSVNQVEGISQESRVKPVVALLLRIVSLSRCYTRLLMLKNLSLVLLLLQTCKVIGCLELIILVVSGKNVINKGLYEVPLSVSLRRRSP